jgi:hypothetical protein
MEYGWLATLQAVRLYAYRLPATRFRPIGDYAFVTCGRSGMR